MTPEPALPRSHIELATILNYVLAALAVVLGMAVGAYFGLVLLLIERVGARSPNPMPDEMMWLFGLMGGALVLLAFVHGAAQALTAYFVSRTRHWTFCVVVASASCLWVPFGTAVGVYTLVVLLRPEVKQLFAEAASGAAPS